MDTVRLTVLPNEPAAELACSYLRQNGIRCFLKRTDVGAGAADGSLSVGGPFEIWVYEADRARAAELLPR